MFSSKFSPYLHFTKKESEAQNAECPQDLLGSNARLQDLLFNSYSTSQVIKISE
jgi:hypothetical protein